MRYTLLALPLALSACAMQAEPDPQPPVAAGCPVLSSSDWVAFVNAMPGPVEAGGPTLNVFGSVVVPTSGYALSTRLGPLDRRLPPSQRVIVELTPPSGPTLQVLTTLRVEGRFPTQVTDYRSVVVVCGDEVLAEITDVETAV